MLVYEFWVFIERILEIGTGIVGLVLKWLEIFRGEDDLSCLIFMYVDDNWGFLFGEMRLGISLFCSCCFWMCCLGIYCFWLFWSGVKGVSLICIMWWFICFWVLWMILGRISCLGVKFMFRYECFGGGMLGFIL